MSEPAFTTEKQIPRPECLPPKARQGSHSGLVFGTRDDNGTDSLAPGGNHV